MERTPGSNDLLMLPSALDVDPDLGRHARNISTKPASTVTSTP